MFSNNSIRSVPLTNAKSHLSCDICGSEEIIETKPFFVCGSCGIELEIQKFQYDRPYNDDIIQYANGLGGTQIGTKRERSISPHTRKFNRLHIQNSVELNDEVILKRAYNEISKIFSSLRIFEFHDLKKMVYAEFTRVYKELRPGYKYRNVPKLVAIVTYLCLKLRYISINSSNIIAASTIGKKEFKEFLSQVRQYLPRYASRDKQGFIIQRIFEITEHFEFGMAFYYQTIKILSKLWEVIKGTSENIIAGIVCSISDVCMYDHKIPVSAICKKLGITQSTVNDRVEKKIFNYFKIGGFAGFVKSAWILRKFLVKWGILKVKDEESQEKDKIELVFGNAAEIFTHNDDTDYYFFAIPNQNNNLTVLFVKIYHPLMNFEEKWNPKKQIQKFIEIDVVKFRKGKDPPLLSPRD